MPRPKRRYLIRDVPAAVAPPTPSAEDRARRLYDRTLRELVAEAAYYRGMRRAAGAGSAEQDWYEAEQEIEARLAREDGAPLP